MGLLRLLARRAISAHPVSCLYRLALRQISTSPRPCIGRHSRATVQMRRHFQSSSPFSSIFDSSFEEERRVVDGGGRIVTTWIAPSSGEIDEDSVISELPQVSEKDYIYTTAIILVTPKLAHLLDLESSSFLQRAISHLYRHLLDIGSRQPSYVCSIAAVVDKIPGPINAVAGEPLNGLQFGAFEGISLMTAGRLHEQHHELYDTISAYQESGTLKFLTKGGEDRRFTAVTLPLANTLFLNGSPFTMIRDTWSGSTSATASAEESRSWSHQSRSNMQNFKTRLPATPDSAFHVSSPLEILTSPRQITNIMGNVIRGIDVDSIDVPASTELEEVVPEFIKQKSENGEDSGKLCVYALIRPPQASEVSREAEAPPTATEDSATTDSDPYSRIWVDSRLYKVTGGGGGWGSKQGLLSLSPDGDSPLDNASESETMDDMGVDWFKQRTNLVPVGSTIQFLCCFENPGKEKLVESRQSSLDRFQNQEAILATDALVTLGVIPSDEVRASSISKELSESVASSGKHLSHTFGMLSEGGAMFSSGRSTPGSKMLGMKTRFDVPNALFTSIITRLNLDHVQRNGSSQARKEQPGRSEASETPSQGKQVVFDIAVPAQGTIVGSLGATSELAGSASAQAGATNRSPGQTKGDGKTATKKRSGKAQKPQAGKVSSLSKQSSASSMVEAAEKATQATNGDVQDVGKSKADKRVTGGTNPHEVLVTKADERAPVIFGNAGVPVQELMARQMFVDDGGQPLYPAAFRIKSGRLGHAQAVHKPRPQSGSNTGGTQTSPKVDPVPTRTYY